MLKNKPFGIIILIVGITLTFSLAGCDIGEEAPLPLSGVYIAGVYNNRACYWKDGIRVDLPTFGSPAGSKATAIAVAGPDVYVVGEDSGNNDITSSSACFWKNGKKIYLEGASAAVTAITVAGSDVYLAGYSYIDDANTYPSYRQVACYWKNGKRTNLQTSIGPSTSSQVYAIAVAGTDVYVAGEHRSYASYTACYWKNGTRTMLAYPSHSRANAVTVAGSDVYFAGMYSDTDNYHFRACYWKNGEQIDLPFPPLDEYKYVFISADAIAVAGADVYLAGSYSTILHEDALVEESSVCYWKNGERINLEGFRAAAIAVAGADVYIAGSYLGGDGERACYWLNGARIELSDEWSWATAITVVNP
jgi:pentose-5-phosphate-3-epimerase